VTSIPEIRELERSEIEPHIPMLLEIGFTPEIDQGVWLGAFDSGALAGFVRVFTEGGAWMLEDVYVFEAYRRRGFAQALIERARTGRDHLWLICDDDMTSYYGGLGFSVAQKSNFPKPLAVAYEAKNEWPEAPDHNHNAMRWPPLP
jgi:GNAT superfamily N-acetyltransferase